MPGGARKSSTTRAALSSASRRRAARKRSGGKPLGEPPSKINFGCLVFHPRINATAPANVGYVARRATDVNASRVIWYLRVLGSRQKWKIVNWSQCPDVVRNPVVMSGAFGMHGTRAKALAVTNPQTLRHLRHASRLVPPPVQQSGHRKILIERVPVQSTAANAHRSALPCST